MFGNLVEKEHMASPQN